jgi:PBP1b-binding outer membrane lipoprotein LpoB
MKKAKLLSIVMAVVLGMTLMSGCSGKSPNEAENQPADTTVTQSPTEETAASSETVEAQGPDPEGKNKL